MHIPLESTRPGAGHASAVVPGSFGRGDLPAERAVREGRGGKGAMPGELRLAMDPGDVGFMARQGARPLCAVICCRT